MTSQDGNLFQQQEANRRRTRWLVIGFILFFAWLGFGADLILYLVTQAAEPGEYRHVVPWFGIAVTAVVAIAALFAARRREVRPNRLVVRLFGNFLVDVRRLSFFAQVLPADDVEQAAAVEQHEN